MKYKQPLLLHALQRRCAADLAQSCVNDRCLIYPGPDRPEYWERNTHATYFAPPDYLNPLSIYLVSGPDLNELFNSPCSQQIKLQAAGSHNSQPGSAPMPRPSWRAFRSFASALMAGVSANLCITWWDDHENNKGFGKRMSATILMTARAIDKAVWGRLFSESERLREDFQGAAKSSTTEPAERSLRKKGQWHSGMETRWQTVVMRRTGCFHVNSALYFLRMTFI